MVEMFVDVRDVVMEKKNLEQLKQDINNNERVFRNMLSTLGVSLEKMKQAIISLMTLEEYGIDCDKIIGIAREQVRIRQQRKQYANNQGYNYPRTW
jgi:hypothetical protein